jgi:uncharacterized delta-60 repeat protein
MINLAFRSKVALGAILFFGVVTLVSSRAASLADWLDTGYRPGIEALSGVPSLAAGADGSVYVDGRQRIRKDGTVDGTFVSALGLGSFVQENVTGQQVDSQGRLLVFGTFLRDDGVSGNVLRLNHDGSVDETFKSPQKSFPQITGGVQFVWTGFVRADDSVVVGGGFEWAERSQRGGLALFKAAGALDPGFAGFPGIPGTGRVQALAPETGGKIVVGGIFTLADGQPANGLARYTATGTRDYGFEPAVGGQIDQVAVQPDGRILVCGRITGRDSANKYIYRLLADGRIDPAFNVVELTRGSVNALVLDASNRILIAGPFTLVSGVKRTQLARLQTDGTVDPAFPTEDGLPGANSLLVQSDGSLLVGGYFLNLLGPNPAQILRLTPDTAYVTSQPPAERLVVGGDLAQEMSEPGTMAVKLSGKIGTTYRIQGSDDLLTWFNLGTVTLDDTGQVIVSDPNGAEHRQRFYRMVEL